MIDFDDNVRMRTEADVWLRTGVRSPSECDSLMPRHTSTIPIREPAFVVESGAVQFLSITFGTCLYRDHEVAPADPTRQHGNIPNHGCKAHTRRHWCTRSHLKNMRGRRRGKAVHRRGPVADRCPAKYRRYEPGGLQT